MASFIAGKETKEYRYIYVYIYIYFIQVKYIHIYVYIHILGAWEGKRGHVNLNSHHVTPNEPDINKEDNK